MDQKWFQIFFGIFSLYFGVQTLRLLPTLLRLLAAVLARKVKWPGGRIHDPNPAASRVRERLGVGYENLFSTFVGNASGVIGAFIFSLFTYLSTTPLLRGYILIKSIWPFMILSLVGLAGGYMALGKALRNQAQVNALLADLAQKAEPRAADGQSAEAAYAIEHPLIGKHSPDSPTTRALDQFYESVRCHQDGKEMQGLALYQEALTQDPSLHAHAREALLRMADSCPPAEAGGVYYWLGIHAEYLHEYLQAAAWYAKAIAAFQKIGFTMRESRAHCNLGSVKMKLAEVSAAEVSAADTSAISEFERAVALNPKNGIAYINIGMIYYLANKHERAIEAFAGAVLADPDRYLPLITARLRAIGYTWKEDLQEISQRAAIQWSLANGAVTADEVAQVAEAYRYFEAGNNFFNSARYPEALAQFEQGQSVAKNLPQNYMGACMSLMQMIETGGVAKEQIASCLIKAEHNIDACLRLNPTDEGYRKTKKLIGVYKKRFQVA